MKRKITLYLIIAVVILLCLNTTSPELANRAIVEALGIDYENNQYTLTARFYSPKSQNQSETLVGKGATIYEAVWDINSKNSREIYLSHNSFVALSIESLKNVSQILTYLNQNTQVRPDVFVVAVENANELINLINQTETTTARSLETQLKNATQNGTLTDMRLFEILRQRNSATTAYTLPYLTINESQIVPNGTIALENDRTVCFFNTEKTVGYNFLHRKIKNLSLTVENTPVKINSSYCRIRSSFNENKLTIFCDVQINAKTEEETNSKKEIKTLLENEIKLKIQNAVTQIFLENNCDIFEFHKILPKNAVNLTEKTEKKVVISVKCHFQ